MDLKGQMKVLNVALPLVTVCALLWKMHVFIRAISTTVSAFKFCPSKLIRRNTSGVELDQSVT